MNETSAKNICDYALSAIEDLSRALNVAQHSLNSEDFEVFKKSIGMSIIRIDTDILAFIYKKYPDLDHINNKK